MRSSQIRFGDLYWTDITGKPLEEDILKRLSFEGNAMYSNIKYTCYLHQAHSNLCVAVDDQDLQASLGKLEAKIIELEIPPSIPVQVSVSFKYTFQKHNGGGASTTVNIKVMANLEAWREAGGRDVRIEFKPNERFRLPFQRGEARNERFLAANPHLKEVPSPDLALAADRLQDALGQFTTLLKNA